MSKRESEQRVCTNSFKLFYQTNHSSNGSIESNSWHSK